MKEKTMRSVTTETENKQMNSIFGNRQIVCAFVCILIQSEYETGA